MKSLKSKISLALILSLLIITLTSDSFAQGTFTFGVQDPSFGKISNRYSINNDNTRTIEDKHSSLTPYFKYRGVSDKTYWNAGIFIRLGKGSYVKDVPVSVGSKQELKSSKESTVVFEYGRGVIVPVNNSFVTFGLNGMVGFQMDNHFEESTVQTEGGNFDKRTIKKVTDYSNMFQIGLTTDISYHQALGGDIYLNIDPKFQFYYQSATNKPLLEESQTTDGVVDTETIYEVVDYKKHDMVFRLIPSIGLTYSF